MKFELIHELREQGVSWDEIGVTDSRRKAYSGWLEAKRSDEHSSDLERNAKVLQAIRLARKELGIERSINNEQIRDIAIHKTFTKDVLNALHKLPKLDFWSADYISDDGDREFIVTLSDLHYTGEAAELDTLHVVYQKLVQLIANEDIKTLHIFELGDVIEGASLRNSQLMGVKKGMVNQVIEVAEAYAQMLAELSRGVNIKFYSVDSSNHTQLRNMGTKQNELVEEDLMLIFNKYIQTRLPQLDMVHDTDLIVNILGYDIFISHGHLVGKKEGYIDKVAATRKHNIDYGFFGHYHHKRDIDLYSIHDGERVYDKKALYVPALTKHESSFERDRFLSSVSGFGVYVITRNGGINLSWKERV